MNGVEHQRRQTELINHVSFVVTVAEIADVLSVGDVRFGQDNRAGHRLVEHVPHQLDRRVGLREMQAGRAEFLPQERDRVQSE